MAFIEKKDPTVINIKITSKGRELLSRGKLNFKKFVIGDSEIDYGLVDKYEFNSNLISILRPKDMNSDIISYLKKDDNSEKYNDIPNIVSNTTIITNQAKTYGFFTNNINGEYELISSPTHAKQPDMILLSSDLTGSKALKLKQANTYEGNINEPEVGDILMIKFDDESNIIKHIEAQPILFYRITNIISGSLYGNDLEVLVDRNIPLAPNNYTETAFKVFNYKLNIDEIINSSYSTDYISNEVFSFVTNIQEATGEIPIWNMSIVFDSEIDGTNLTNLRLKDLLSTKYASFISYIQNHTKKYNKLGIIHFTNQMPSNTFGEGLYNNTPYLTIPTIQWHKSGNAESGLILEPHGGKKILNGLNIEYYDLSDEYNNIVGKVFNGLKLFVIEDQELLYAMSYKSNRSWTLPSPIVNTNLDLSSSCPDCNLDCTILGLSTNSIENDGIIRISNIINNAGSVYVEVRNSSTNEVEYLDEITTYDNYEILVPIGTYLVKVMDFGNANCNVTSIVNITLST